MEYNIITYERRDNTLLRGAVKERGYACYARPASCSEHIKVTEKTKVPQRRTHKQQFYCAYLLGKTMLIMIMRARKEGCMLLPCSSVLFKCGHWLRKPKQCAFVYDQEFRLFAFQSTLCIVNE